MKKPLCPSKATEEILANAKELSKIYTSLYYRYLESIAKGGHGSCCERQTCYRQLDEDNMLEKMTSILMRKW